MVNYVSWVCRQVVRIIQAGTQAVGQFVFQSVSLSVTQLSRHVIRKWVNQSSTSSVRQSGEHSGRSRVPVMSQPPSSHKRGRQSASLLWLSVFYCLEKMVWIFSSLSRHVAARFFSSRQKRCRGRVRQPVTQSSLQPAVSHVINQLSVTQPVHQSSVSHVINQLSVTQPVHQSSFCQSVM